ncbi:MAG: hypothetical protein ACK4PI_11075 [Tepidisphaerales bacterium]
MKLRPAAPALLAACTGLFGPVALSFAQPSAPAILQWFDGSWRTMERRSADSFRAGYGALWIPPPSRADSGNFSVGYDVYDRFDLGRPNSPTLYGTESGLKAMIGTMRRAGGTAVYADLVWNHNGFRDASTPGFVAEGGYPGFVLQWPGTTDGDFHSAFVPPGANADYVGRLAGLIDINQATNIQLIRHPTTAGNPQNIPAGTWANRPDPRNARFYPDRSGSPARMLFDPTTGESNIAVYDFNLANPMAGTPVAENALGLLMRHAQWMVQVIGVDGFRLDATKHMPPWVLNYLDRAVYRANPRPLLNGGVNHVFSFGEFFDGNPVNIQPTIRKDINPADPGRIGGNRDALDFPLYFALRDNLTSNGIQNDWRNVINNTLDRNDDGLANNGSQGVGFAMSHDKGAPHLNNVAHAYVLLRPGNAVVYYNAKEFGAGRDFPGDGRGDALGGQFGNTITTLVDIRARYPQGNFNPRLVQKETIVIERENSLVAGLSNRLDAGYDARTVMTAFAPGTPLLELTGNAADPAVDPFNDIPELLIVNGDRTVNLRVPRNRAPGPNNTQGNFHGKGYVIYGPAGPQGTLSLTNVAFTFAPDPATPATNGTARVSPVSVIRSDSFQIRLQTVPVNLLGFYRDVDADGDNAVYRINGGMDFNGNGVVDFTTPGSVVYGFEQFTTKRSPLIGGGDGEFVQTIDATRLPEGLNFIEVRAFRRRNPTEPVVFSAWRETVYIDRLPPQSEVVSFDPVVPGVTQNRRLEVRSIDLTANNVHVFLNLPAARTESQILALLGAGNQANRVDRELWWRDYASVVSGNHVATVVTFEETGNYSILRVPGLFAATSLGGGLGDLNYNGLYEPADIDEFGRVLLSFNTLFNPAADLNGDGLVDFTDLHLLGDRLVAVNAPPQTLASYNILLRGVVPEPAAGLTVLLAAFLPLRRHRRRPGDCNEV